MKYKTKSLETDGVILSSSGDNLDSKVIVNEPDTNLSITTKKYTLDKLDTIKGQHFTSGTIDITRLPEFIGDLTKPESSDTITLKNSLVSPGTYVKVTVDIRGVIISKGVLVEGDIPTLPWNKINNTPTTLQGYGITNALSNEGGQMLGQLKVGVCSDINHLSDKKTVDDFVKLGNIEIGGMVLKLNNNQVPNFLRCNGGEVSKDTYQNLYTVIGDKYSVSYSPGFGLPHLQQLGFNNVSSTTSGWTSRGTLPDRINSAKSLVTKNKVYIIGGSNATGNNGSLNTIYTCPINADGSIGSWTLYGRLPITVDSFELVVNVNRVYLIGGNSNGVDLSTIYSTTIDDSGNLGTWSLLSNLPFVLSSMVVLITKNLLTVIGGSYNGTGVLNTMQVTINSDGSLGTWISGPSLPSSRVRSGLLVTGNFVYIVGGSDGSSSLNTVIRSSILPDGSLSNWTSYSNIPINLQDMGVVCTASRVYLIGGSSSNSSTSNKVYSAPVNQDGSIGSWVAGSNLSEAVKCFQVFITNSRLHICGGYRLTTRINAVRSCNFTGGLNDYSEFYQVDKRATDNGYFRLPDVVSPLETANYYIRY